MVRPGALEVRGGDATLTTLGLGSCVSIGLHDPVAGVGGLTHCLLPEPSAGAEPAVGRYTTTAVPRLLELLVEAGGEHGRVQAWLAGGASMFPSLSDGIIGAIGTRNVAAARRVLEELGIPLIGEETGGHHGRSIHFHVGRGEFIVRSVLRPEVVL